MSRNEEEAPVISTPKGQVRGLRRTTIYDDRYHSFEGIPFGKPPLGELRFCAPQPADPWTGIRDCSSANYKPIQRNHFKQRIEGSEDCLYLNIYTKKLVSERPLPVMVWIHGGRFFMGDCSRECYGPDYFMQQDIILVTFNYRVCSLGFLSLADPDLQVPGNAALKDQVLALKWIKQNITHFNGDTNNITVFGHSAGSVCAHFLAATDQARGLFHKVILMSATISHSFFLPQADAAYRLAKYHGYEGENIDRQVLCYLRGLEAEKLVTHDLLTDEEKRSDYLYLFAPTVEPYESDDCVIPREPLEMMQTAWSNTIPMMLGGTSFEGLLWYPFLKKQPSKTALLITDPESVLPIEVRKSHSVEERKKMAEKIIHAHFGDSELNEKAIFQHLELLSYKIFWHSYHRTVLSRMAHAPAPTFLYRFDFDSPTFNRHRTRFCGKDAVRGVAHADDLSYLFLFPESWKLSPETSEYRTIQRMVGMWTAFARNSEPNCAEIEPTVWHPLQPDAPDMALNIGYQIEMMRLPETEKLHIWDSLYDKDDLYWTNYTDTRRCISKERQ